MRARAVARIARWEVLKGTETVTRRTVAGVLLTVAVSALLGAAISGASVSHDAGLYRIGVAQDSPYYGPAAADDTFAVRDPSRRAFRAGELDILVVDGRILVADDRKGRAALAEFRSTVERYNDRLLADDDPSAAFPVDVRLRYVERSELDPTDGTADGGGGQSGGEGTGSGGGDGGGAVGPAGGDDLSVPRIGGQPLLAGSQAGTPSSIDPPFPLGALILAFLFVVPMNFVIQAYGASILRERMNRRGELLLVAPVSPLDIVAGKTLPYFLGLVAVAAVTAVGVGGGALAVAAAAPLGLLFLAATFVAAMFARSFKELTFLTVTISVTLTSYAFVPAIFTEVTPIALISPLTLVVRDLLGTPTTVGEYLFSTGPFYLCSAVLFLLGAGIYREEDLFTQRPVHLKAVDALASRVATGRRGIATVALLTVALLPFVLLAELLALSLLFALPVAVAVPALLAAVALIEELAKSAHVYAAHHHDRFDRSLPVAAAVGAASGVAFFVGEKVTVVAQVVGLPELTLGRVTFTDAAAVDATGAGVPLVLALLLAPLALHTLTATLSGLGASRGPRYYAAGYAAAVLVHFAYNLGVVVLVT